MSILEVLGVGTGQEVSLQTIAAVGGAGRNGGLVGIEVSHFE